MPHRFVFVWENLGPMHEDRIAAVAERYPGEVAAIQFWPSSDSYDWVASPHAAPTQTLFPAVRLRAGLGLGWRLLRACRQQGAREVFLCHYQFASVFFAAVLLRLTGCRVYCMIDSKFDDYRRDLRRELGKAILLLPYTGAFVGTERSRQYLSFLGFRNRPIALGYDALSVGRIREQAPTAPAPDGAPHSARDFLIVARLVAKKNIELALDAFAQLRAQTETRRRLQILGSGELEERLRARARELGIEDSVIFEGFVQTERVSEALSRALCLILPSREEQFGLVVIEAMAMGVPALVSANAGAVDLMIDNGVNGWIVDPASPRALLAAMLCLDEDGAEWARMAAAARDDSYRGDSHIFAEGVAALTAAR